MGACELEKRSNGGRVTLPKLNNVFFDDRSLETTPEIRE